MSWGYKISLLYGSFVVFILTLVVLSSMTRVDLVKPDYYVDEIKYQEQITKLNRTRALADKLSVTVIGKEAILRFPSTFEGKALTGEVLFFKPDNQNGDYKVPVSTAHLEQRVDASNLRSGKYRVQVSWTCDGLDYFDEQVVFMK